MKQFRISKVVACCIPLLLLVACGCAEEKPVPPGLTVENGQFCKDGKPFYGVGINYFSCFIRITGMVPNGPKPDNRDYVEGFRTLKSYNIPFVRFCAGGFFPDDWKLYRTDKELYFKLLDGLVAEAEKQGMGLIPSLFWTYSTIPDLMGESLDQLGNPKSKTQAFIRQYTTEVVSRYKDSPAIWGWEFGNEWIHEADLPQAEFGRGWIAPEFGTPAVRSAKDKMFRPTIDAAYRAFYETVRALDQTRPVFTGDSMPRPAAWHHRNGGTWDEDSPEQWKEMLLADNPFGTLAVHFYYYRKEDRPRDVGVLQYDPAEQMAFLMKISAQAGKPLFIGEFGQTADPSLSVEKQYLQLNEMLRMIVQNHVQLSALWNFDFEHKDQNHCNITATNERAGMLELLKRINTN
jgi:hypothetical protein